MGIAQNVCSWSKWHASTTEKKQMDTIVSAPKIKLSSFCLRFFIIHRVHTLRPCENNGKVTQNWYYSAEKKDLRKKSRKSKNSNKTLPSTSNSSSNNTHSTVKNTLLIRLFACISSFFFLLLLITISKKVIVYTEINRRK